MGGFNELLSSWWRNRPQPPIRTLHQHIQSVGATGGVYKGQGRNQRDLMNRAY
jgi:hypothetical protein